jgi:hypothetical protein
MRACYSMKPVRGDLPQPHAPNKASDCTRACRRLYICWLFVWLWIAIFYMGMPLGASQQGVTSTVTLPHRVC